LIAWARPPLVPVICRTNVPAGAFREVTTLNVTLVPVVGFGVNDAVTLLGSPLIAKRTDPENPVNRVIVMV